MRVALCFSGHLRGMDGTRAFWDSLPNKDVYISSWSDIMVFPSQQIRPLDMTKPERYYSPVKWEIDHYNLFEEQFRREVEPYRAWQREVGGSIEEYYDIARFRSIWYKAERSVNLVNDNDYDLIIKSRTDFVIVDGEFEWFFNPPANTVFSVEDTRGDHGNWGNAGDRFINDWFLVGRPADVKKVCNIYSNWDNLYQRARRNNDPLGFYNPHAMLYEQGRYHGIYIQPLRMPIDLVRNGD